MLELTPRSAWLLTAAAFLSTVSCSEATSPTGPPAAPHRAASVRVIGGSGQTGIVGALLSQQIVVEVLDSAGQPAWGRPLQARGIPVSDAVTDRTGHATFTWQLGPLAGIQSVRIDPAGQDHNDALSPTVYATALPAPFHHIAVSLLVQNANWLTSTPLTRDRLFSPRDTFNNVVPWPSDVGLIAPSGWSIHTDTAVPPSAEYVGLASIGIQAGGKVASAAITRVDDLRARRWTVSLSCAAKPGVPVVEYGGAPLDSLSFSGTAAVVASGSDPDPQGGKLDGTFAAYRFYFRGTRIVYRTSGRVDTLAVTLFRYDIPTQRPDTLVFPYPASSGSVTTAAVPVQPGANPRYVGGSWCDPALYSVRSPVTLISF